MSVLDNIYFSRFIRPMNLSRKAHDSESLFVRVYCKACGHTHALLLSSMIPYSQIPLVLHVRLIHANEHETGFQNILAEQYLMDENNLKSIIRNYRLHWKQRLRSMRLYLPDIPSLISGCFSLFSRQFMQIKSTSNKLFILPT